MHPTTADRARIDTAARTLLENYLAIRAAEDAAYTWLERLWPEVRGAFETGRGEGHTGWILKLLTVNSGQTVRGAPGSRSIVYGVALTRPPRDGSRLSGGRVVSVEAYDIRWVPPTHEGDRLHVHATSGSLQNFKALRDAHPDPSRFNRLLAGARASRDFKPTADTQVFWQHHIALGFDGEDNGRIAAALLDEVSAVTGLLAGLW